jgi:uncharacterized protein YjbI with pentapeptide repeats
LEKWHFQNCKMKFTIFSGQNSNLSKTKFTKCTLDGAFFYDAPLLRSEFNACTFKKTSFRGSRLIHASFKHCNFENVDFTGAELKNCSFEGRYPSAESLETATSVFPLTLGGTICNSWVDFQNAGGK